MNQEQLIKQVLSIYGEECSPTFYIKQGIKISKEIKETSK